MTTKVRQHNEWFRSISLGGRKSCPCCKTKLELGESIWSWGEYHNAKWRTIKHFCSACYATEVRDLLIKHTDGCGCTINLVIKDSIKPAWLTLSNESEGCIV